MLCFRNDFFNIAVGADGIDIGLISQFRKGRINNGRRVYFLYVKGTAVRSKPLFGFTVGILNDCGRNIVLLGYSEKKNQQSANYGNKKDQQSELLQIAKNTELFHAVISLSESLSEKNMRRDMPKNVTISISTAPSREETNPICSANPVLSELMLIKLRAFVFK